MLRRGNFLFSRNYASKSCKSVAGWDDNLPVFEEKLESGCSKVTLNNGHTFFVDAASAGKGAFGEVYPVRTSITAQNPKYCVKHISLSSLVWSFENEAEVLNGLGRETFEFELDGRPAMFTEWQIGMPLSNCISDEMQKLPLHVRLELLYSGLKNIKDMHDKGYSHNDLHFGNIVVDIAKRKMSIIDFGAASKITGRHDRHSDAYRFMYDVRLILFSDVIDRNGRMASNKLNSFARDIFNFIKNLAGDYLNDPDASLAQCKSLLEKNPILHKRESNAATRRLT